MKKETKMYSLEVVDKALQAVAKGFSLSHENFKESLEGLPEEIQLMVASSVLTGHMVINAQMKKVFSKASEVEKKLKELKNPTKEDAERLFREAFEKLADEK